MPERRKEEYEREKRRRKLAEQEQRLALRALYKATGIERNATIAFSVSILLIIASLFAFLMLRQAEIVDKNFAINRLENKINALENENRAQYESILEKVDLAEVEQKAFELYGLRKPAQAQRIYVNVPEVDRVIRHQDKDLSAAETTGEISEKQESIAFDSTQIELYMKKLRTQE